MRVRSSVSIYGALDEGSLLPKIFPENDAVLLLLVSDLLDLRKNLRQDAPLLVLENKLSLDGKAGILEDRCLKYLGRVGMQPTVMLIDISANLVSCQ